MTEAESKLEPMAENQVYVTNGVGILAMTREEREFANLCKEQDSGSDDTTAIVQVLEKINANLERIADCLAYDHITVREFQPRD